MNAVTTVLAASATTFAATNIDDIFLLTLFFARKISAPRIVGGQYLGFIAILLLSCLGALLTLSIPPRWIRLLGFLPLALGIKQLLHRKVSSAVLVEHAGDIVPRLEFD
jgi:cadmium resistance protein CadD (predicted permease)